MRPLHFTDRPRKYLAGQRYVVSTEIEILGGGHIRAGTRFSATGQLGSMLYKPCRGKKHPEDLLIEVRQRLQTRQPYVFIKYWIPARLFDDPDLIIRIRRRQKKEEAKRNIHRALEKIIRCAQSV